MRAWRPSPLHMPTSLSSYTLHGLTVHPIQMEVDVTRGMPHFAIIGMASTSVQEAKERVRGAIVHSGFTFPMNRKVVNLAPAEMVKSGSHFDLTMAVGCLIASGQMKPIPKDVMLIGELGLEGGVRPVTGLLPALLSAKAAGVRQVLIPQGNLHEASLVRGLELIAVKSLREVVSHFEAEARSPERIDIPLEEGHWPWDFAEVCGQWGAKRALMIAALGGHHVLMMGPPGSGKSFLARCFPSILPPLGQDELLEVLRVHSVAGRTMKGLERCRPFRPVHPSTTGMGLIGGGAHLRPGEVSLAHKGVLFMDEFAEFKRSTLELLREPLENKEIALNRNQRHSTYPCEFQLLAAMNPCPCGNYGNPLQDCRCSPHQIARYQGRVSGPVLDRIDMHVEVPRLSYSELRSKSMDSASMRATVMEACERRRARKKDPALNADCQRLLKQACEHYGLSGRAVHRTIRVARSIADLEGSHEIREAQLAEALQYRLPKAML